MSEKSLSSFLQDLQSEPTLNVDVDETGHISVSPVGVNSMDSNGQLQSVLNERGAEYGDFEDISSLCQTFKETIALASYNLEPFHREALEQIVHKMSRILNGNPDHMDSWFDIAGYAQCVMNILTRRQDNG